MGKFYRKLKMIIEAVYTKAMDANKCCCYLCCAFILLLLICFTATGFHLLFLTPAASLTSKPS
jgi:hypothetical protein